MASPPRHPFLLLVLALAALLRAEAGGGEPRKTYIFRVDHGAKPSVFPTHAHWYASAAFASVGGGAGAPLEPIHVYGTVFHGFSASVPASRAEALRRHPAVLAAFEDRVRAPHTTRSPQFMGLRARLGLWSLADYGSDVIVGVLDTGVWPERRSLSDRNLPPVPARWRGGCDAGPGFPASSCNRKLVGARFFSQGHDAHYGAAAVASNGSVEFLSPRDADGHGTHTATTAAGSVAYEASMEGYASGVAKGVAPNARVAAYKVCWKGAGCMDSDILAGFDRAVADGVDVISVSIGGGSGVTAPFYLDPIAIGAYGAVSRGVFVATSAGNEGPTSMSVTNLAPWIATVGAGTIDRNFPAEIVLGDGRRLSGVSLYSGRPLPSSSLPLYYPGRTGGLSASLCMENSIDPSLVKGKIVVCDRGSSPRVAKGMVVKEAGGAAMVLTNGEANGEGLVGDPHVLPACAVGEKEGDALKAYAANASNPAATISFGGTVVGVKPAPVVASFSARGPNGLVPEILKPDFIAPGVNILAAWTGATGPTGLEGDTRRTEFNILSGTSMACPHASGAAALLRSAHPGWSPAAIRSALMTTAIVTDNRRGPVGDEAEPGRSATPLDYGAGHITLGKALDPRAGVRRRGGRLRRVHVQHRVRGQRDRGGDAQARVVPRGVDGQRRPLGLRPELPIHLRGAPWRQPVQDGDPHGHQRGRPGVRDVHRTRADGARQRGVRVREAREARLLPGRKEAELRGDGDRPVHPSAHRGAGVRVPRLVGRRRARGAEPHRGDVAAAHVTVRWGHRYR